MMITEKKIWVVKVVYEFDAILKDVKNNWMTTNSISVKICGSNINLWLLIIKLLNTATTMLKKEFEFDEAFNIFVK